MLGTCYHDIGSDPESEEREGKIASSMTRPHEGIWVSDTPAAQPGPRDISLPYPPRPPPNEITTILKKYFTGFWRRFTISTFMTRWIDLQVDITMGSTISPSLFIMAMKVIFDQPLIIGHQLCVRAEFVPRDCTKRLH